MIVLDIETTGTDPRFHSIASIGAVDFDEPERGEFYEECHPKSVNIGADSKRHNLPEPTMGEVLSLVAELTRRGIEVRKKFNLDRLAK